MKVVILSGGFGTRLSEETHIKPKPMVNIGSEPILWHLMKIYSHYGFNEFIILLGYKGHIIKEYFLSGERLNINVKYIEEKSFLGTAGSLCYLKNLKDQTLIVSNCDVLSSIDYGEALDYHKANSVDATMVVRNYEAHNSFGVI